MWRKDEGMSSGPRSPSYQEPKAQATLLIHHTSIKAQSTYHTTHIPSAQTSPTMPSIWWSIATLSSASSVALGAFGAHGLKNRISDPSKISSWSTAANYQVLPASLHESPKLTVHTWSEKLTTPPLPVARPLHSPPNSRNRRSKECHCQIPLYGWHYHVLRFDLFVGAGSAEFQAAGTGDASWGELMLHWWMG